MAKNTIFNKERIRKRYAIQLFCKKYPDVSNAKVAQIFEVSPLAVSRWKKIKYLNDKKRERKTKMTRDIKNFLLKKCRNKFTGINKASSRKLSKEILKFLM